MSNIKCRVNLEQLHSRLIGLREALKRINISLSEEKNDAPETRAIWRLLYDLDVNLATPLSSESAVQIEIYVCRLIIYLMNRERHYVAFNPKFVGLDALRRTLQVLQTFAEDIFAPQGMAQKKLEQVPTYEEASGAARPSSSEDPESSGVKPGRLPREYC